MGPVQRLEGAFVPESGANTLEQPRDRLQIVSEHLRSSLEDDIQQFRFAGEVLGQHLHADSGVGVVDLPDRLGTQPCTFVGQVVTAHTGDGGVSQSHLGDGLGNSPWFIGVVALGFGGVDLAEVAASSALVATDEEGGFAILPTLEDVRAPGLLAHRVELGIDHAIAHVPVLGAHRGGGADPSWLVLDRGLGILDLDAQQFASVSFDTHARDSILTSPPTPDVAHSSPICGMRVATDESRQDYEEPDRAVTRPWDAGTAGAGDVGCPDSSRRVRTTSSR